MTRSNLKPGFASRPLNPDTWVRTRDVSVPKSGPKADYFTARLTIDITPELRARIKVAAFRRGITVAQMLRDLLTTEFPPRSRGTA